MEAAMPLVCSVFEAATETCAVHYCTHMHAQAHDVLHAQSAHACTSPEAQMTIVDDARLLCNAEF